MKISKLSAFIAAAVIAVSSMAGCNSDKRPTGSTGNTNPSGPINQYKDNPEIGKEKIDIGFNEDANHNNTTFKLNRVIDSGKATEDGQKYIYADITLKNNMDSAYQVNALNNFYLILPDETEVFTDIRADLYAKQSINGYEQLLEIPANSEFNGYIGFLIKPDVTSFSFCYFATANENDKETVIRCPVASSDIIPAPDGFLK